MEKETKEIPPFRAVIVDFDRTLLRTDKTLSPRTLRALEGWQASGGRLFAATARPERAIPLDEKFVALCREKGFRVETGIFGADMQVESVNSGPVTLVVDTDQL